MDENKEVRVVGFFEAKCQELESQVKVLQFDNAELETQNNKLYERVKKLASRHPQWPAGYRPRKYSDNGPKISK